MGLEERAQTRTIDGIEYKTHPVTFGVGRPLLLKVAKAAAPMMKAIATNATRVATGGDAEVQSAMAEAFSAIISNIDDRDLAQMAQAFGDVSSYFDGKNNVPLISMTQEMHFAGRYDAFVQWLLFCMEVNGFARFFTSITSGSAT